MEERRSKQALSGRARGIIVGSLITLAWWVYGSSIFTPGVRLVAISAAGLLTLALLIVAARILQRVQLLPPAAPTEITASQRVWRWFWLNLIGEIILLNAAIALLGAPDLKIYWIAAISGVVGLHFLPMAVFFRTRSYWFVGIAMIGSAMVAAAIIARSNAWAADIAHIEGLANALILWSGLIFGTMVDRLAISKFP